MLESEIPLSNEIRQAVFRVETEKCFALLKILVNYLKHFKHTWRFSCIIRLKPCSEVNMSYQLEKSNIDWVWS